MTPLETGQLISQIGLICQLVTTLLLAMLFGLLRRAGYDRTYFHYWFWSWVALSFALVVLLQRFAMSDVPVFVESAASQPEHLLAAVYQVCKMSCLALLLFGSLNFCNGLEARRLLWPSFGFAIAFSALVFTLTTNLTGVMIWQGVANVVVYTACAVLLFKVPAARRAGAVRVTASVFLMLSLFWVALFAIGSMTEGHVSDELARILMHLTLYNGYVDLFLQVLLAFGMVLILSEEAQRKIKRMHAELELSHRDLKEESVRDSLTRALNRRALAEGTGLESALADAGTVMVFDLDNLKQVNDRYGHETGDALLKHFVDTLGGQLRDTDKLYRYGGDEFLLVMPQAKLADVSERFDRFFATAPGLCLPGTDASLALEVSFGAAAYTGKRFDAAITEADKLMYANKRQHKLRKSDRQD